jgi:hypothetical protein
MVLCIICGIDGLFELCVTVFIFKGFDSDCNIVSNNLLFMGKALQSMIELVAV